MRSFAGFACLALLASGCGSSDGGADEADASASADGALGDAPAAADVAQADATLGDSGAFDAAQDALADGCPIEMARIAAFCVDRWEAHVVLVDDAGAEQPHSPYLTVDGENVRAKSAAGVVPQGYISQVEASAACLSAGKRLCA